MILTITGHRPPKLGGYSIPNPVYSTIIAGLLQAFRDLQPQRVYLGMALGADQWAANVCVSLRIPFVACIPFIGYQERWPERAQQEYQRLLGMADDVIYVARRTYEARLMQVRNEFMVDHCDRVLAVWNGAQEGGTWNCIRYAHRVGKRVDRLNIPDAIWGQAARQQVGREVAPPPIPTPRAPRLAPTARPSPRAAPVVHSNTEMFELLAEAVRDMHPAQIDDILTVDDVVAETGKVVLKETIEPERRFVPGRLLDVDDDK